MISRSPGWSLLSDITSVTCELLIIRNASDFEAPLPQKEIPIAVGLLLNRSAFFFARVLQRAAGDVIKRNADGVTLDTRLLAAEVVVAVAAIEDYVLIEVTNDTPYLAPD